MDSSKQNISHFQEIEKDLIGIYRLLESMKGEVSAERATFFAAAKYKLLRHAATIGQLSIDLNALEDNGELH